MIPTLHAISDREILAARGPKDPVDSRRPYASWVEPEFSSRGVAEEVATIFLTNRECPFRCLMCDLWKHTTDETVPLGAIPEQIDYALARLPAANQVKLYNSGNFFDHRAIPPADYPAIAQRLRSFQTVIVENHPLLCGADCITFRDLLASELEIAIGLETVHPGVLAHLNKRMTLDDFSRATAYLRGERIRVRVFILLRPPFLSEQEGLEWAHKSLEFAFAAGVECCSVIPTRSGNGIMEQLQTAGQFAPPQLTSLESVLAAGLALRQGRVFVDLWDVEKLVICQQCGPARIDRLRKMNLTQQLMPQIGCVACGGSQ